MSSIVIVTAATAPRRRDADQPVTRRLRPVRIARSVRPRNGRRRTPVAGQRCYARRRERPRRRARALLGRPGDRLLPRRLLPHRRRRPRFPRRLRGDDGGVPRVLGRGGERPRDAAAAVDVPGLRPGDRWCVVAARWQEALEAGVAPPVVLEATHASALEFVSLGELEAHAVQPVAAASRRLRQ